MVPASLMAALVLGYNYRQQHAALVGDSIADAHTLSQVVDRELATAQVSLNVLAASPSLESRDLGAFHRQAQEVLKRGFINNVVLFDASSQQLVNTVVPFGLPLPKTAQVDKVERVLQTGRPVVVGLVTGAVLKKPIISVMVPVVVGPSATTTHVLGGVILPEHFTKLLDSHGLPSDRIAVIFDQTDTMVTHSHERERFIGKVIAPDLSERLQQTKQGAFDRTTRDGVQVLSSFSRSPVTGWGVSISIPYQSLQRDLHRAMAILFVAMLILIGLVMMGAWRMGGHISDAVRALLPPAHSLGRGENVEVAPLGIREVDDLGEALTSASLLLQSTRSALADSEARMSNIVQAALDAIITVDDRQVIVQFNSAAEKMFGCPSERAVGQAITRYIPERFDARRVACPERNPVQTTDANTLGVAGVTVGVRSGGEEFPVEVSHSSVKESGAVFHTMIIRDVTARVRTQEALERSNLDLQQFAYVASHDLKTPLRSIAGFVQLLERDHSARLDEKGLALIQRTESAVQRLEQLTEDLLSYARIEAEAKQFVPVDLGEVAHDVAQLLDAPIRAAHAVLTIGDLPVVLGDQTQLAQLLLNLLGNSLKYCRDRAPEVELSAVLKEREWEFSVKDNGIGMEAKHYDKVFEVFKRLHTQSEYPGTGIGLAVCRRVVQGHGGKIWVTSESGVGCTFSFTLPVYFLEPSHET